LYPHAYVSFSCKFSSHYQQGYADYEVQHSFTQKNVATHYYYYYYYYY